MTTDEDQSARIVVGAIAVLPTWLGELGVLPDTERPCEVAQVVEAGFWQKCDESVSHKQTQICDS